MDIAIHVEDLSVSYGEKPVLWDIDVDIGSGSITAIVGPNGAGKSTLIQCILGFVKPLAGTITIYGHPLQDVRKRIAYVPQTSTVNWDFPVMVEDVVLMGCYSSLGWLKHPTQMHRQRAYQALKQMEMISYRHRQISQLSGGQKQRVFIARALCQSADLLIMDEPLAGVDRVSEAIIMDTIRQLQTQGKTIVCVHHDLHTLRQYFTHIVMINRFIIAQGRIADVLNEKNLANTYGETIHV